MRERRFEKAARKEIRKLAQHEPTEPEELDAEATDPEVESSTPA